MSDSEARLVRKVAVALCILSFLISLGTFCLVFGSGQNWLVAMGSALFALVAALIVFFFIFIIILGASTEEEEEDEDSEYYEGEEDEVDEEGDETRTQVEG